jgi:hypothetical protein
MEIKEITMYRTDDGNTFPTKDEAEHHIRLKKATEYIKRDECFSEGDYYNNLNIKNGEELYDFLIRNSDWIKELMGWEWRE